MKKLFALVLALVLCLPLVACGSSTPDVQPALDAYNELAANYNKFVDLANEDIEALDPEDVETLNACAAIITEYSVKLTSDTEFTQEEIDEMVEKFTSFNETIEDWIVVLEG